MAIFDIDTRKVVVRVVYDGPGLAGKTTNLQQLCRVFTTFRRSELYSPEASSGRTTFLDWLQIDSGLVGGYPLRSHFITVPGQMVLARRRFQLLEVADVVVFVADSTANGLREAGPMLDLLRLFLDQRHFDTPIVVQANKQDVVGALDTQAIARRFALGPEIPIVPAQADGGVGVRETAVLAIRAAANRVQTVLRERGAESLAGTAETGEQLRARIATLEAEEPMSPVEVVLSRGMGPRAAPPDEAVEEPPSIDAAVDAAVEGSGASSIPRTPVPPAYRRPMPAPVVPDVETQPLVAGVQAVAEEKVKPPASVPPPPDERRDAASESSPATSREPVATMPEAPPEAPEPVATMAEAPPGTGEPVATMPEASPETREPVAAPSVPPRGPITMPVDSPPEPITTIPPPPQLPLPKSEQAPPPPSVRPPMPTADVASGYVWPSTSGRDVLRRVPTGEAVLRIDLAGSHGVADGSGRSDALIYEAGIWCLKTSLRRRFADTDEARNALVQLARRKIHLGEMLVHSTALSLEKDADGALWLWTVTPWLTTLRGAMTHAADHRDQTRLGVALTMFAEMAVTCAGLAARQGVVLDVHPSNFASFADKLYYLDDDIGVGGQVPAFGHAVLRRVDEYAEYPSALSAYLGTLSSLLISRLTREEVEELDLPSLVRDTLVHTDEGHAAKVELLRALERVRPAPE